MFTKSGTDFIPDPVGVLKTLLPMFVFKGLAPINENKPRKCSIVSLMSFILMKGAW